VDLPEQCLIDALPALGPRHEQRADAIHLAHVAGPRVAEQQPPQRGFRDVERALAHAPLVMARK
jgi:hypothetical protein